MFTGIITACLPVSSQTQQQGILRLTIQKPADWKLNDGESISINGVCSTVVSSSKTTFEVQYMPETVEVTAVRDLKKSDLVNLERSMTVNDLLSGHLVSGHVDAVSEVLVIQPEGDSYRLTLSIPSGGAKYLIHKGSIAINGVSLTVIEPTETQFEVAIIPHTWQETNLRALTVGARVHLEYDMIGKYIERQQRYG